MNKKETSLKAYLEITENGTIEKLKHKVWKFVIDNGPCTQDDCFSFYMQQPGFTTGSYTARFSDLKREGVITEVGTRVNVKTGKSNELWDVTGNSPIKFEKPKRIKCTTCNGKGHIEQTQSKWDI